MPIRNSTFCNKAAANPLGYVAVPRDSPLLRQRPVEDASGTSSCSLHFMRDRVFLLSFLHGAQHVLASHWVRHYTRNVGLRAENIRAFVHSSADSADTQRTIDHLTAAGVPSAALQLLNRSFPYRMRLATINKAMHALPKGAWVINADVDEFFDYPCSVRARIDDGNEVFCGEMRDRLSPKGMAVLQVAGGGAPSIEAQFPGSCYVRQHWRGRDTHSRAAVSKVVLMRAEKLDGTRRAFVDSHHISGYRRHGMTCRALGYAVSHYTLTAQALQNIRKAKLRRGSDFRHHREMYASIARFMLTHESSDASAHPWCQLPARPAASGVTLFTNSFLDYCGVPLTELGDVRAV